MTTDADLPNDATSAPVLHGEIVRLRPLADADVAAIDAILAEPEVARWWRRAEWGRVVEHGATCFAIEVEGEVAGCIQYAEELDPDYRSASLDIFLSERYAGRGAGGDAMRTLLSYLVGVRGHHRVTVDPSRANARAIHVYEKLGFRRVGVLRRYERGADGVWRDALLMEFVAEP